MFSDKKTEALKGYKSFVNKKIPEEIKRIPGSKKWPSVIGKESFINWIKDSFFIQKRHVEVPEADLTPYLVHPPLNSPFRFSMNAEIASARSSEGMIMLDLAAL